MKILVHNYSSEINTEPLYINEAAKSKGLDSIIWNNQESAFDIFDKHRPDLYITSWRSIRKDTVERLLEEDIKVMINITGAKPDILDTIHSFKFKSIFFQNEYQFKNIPTINYCADTFMAKRKVEPPDYNLDTLFIVLSENNIKESKYYAESKHISYHLITPFMKSSFHCDAKVSIGGLYGIYPKYKQIYTFDQNQLFYDAAYYNGSCFNINNLNKITKQEILDLHTPYNRLEELLTLQEKNG